MADLFIKVRDKVNSNFQEMISRGDAIFMAPPTGQKLFVSYLTAFGGLVPANRSLIFRGYNTHACMACSKFINHFGFITSLEKTDNGFTRHTLWENMSDIIDGTEYEAPISTLDKIVKESKIQSYFKPSEGWLQKDDIKATKTKAGNYVIGTPEENLLDHFDGDTSKYFRHYVDGHEGMVTPLRLTDKGELELDITGEKIPAIVKRSDTEEYTFQHFYINVPKSYVVAGKDASWTTELHNAYSSHINAMKEVFGSEKQLVTKEAWDKMEDLFNQKRLLLKDEKLWLVELGKKVFNETQDLTPEQLEDYLNYLCFKCTCTTDEHGRTKASFIGIKKDVIFGGFLQPYSGTGMIREKDENGNDIEIEGSKMKGNEQYAIARYNTMADPANRGVKSDKALTAMDIFNFERGLKDGGWEPSLHRRFATIEDIDKSEIFYDAEKESKSGTVLDAGESTAFKLFKEMKQFKPELVSKTVTGNNGGFIPFSQFDNCRTITIEQLFKDELPKSKNMNIFLTSLHEGNVSILTTSDDPKSKNILRWHNPFAIVTKDGTSYKSSKLVQKAAMSGSYVYAPFSFSVLWHTNCDWDGHVKEYGPNGGFHLYYGSESRKRGGRTRIDRLTSLCSRNGFKTPSGTYYSYREYVQSCVKNGLMDELNQMMSGWFDVCPKSPTDWVQDQDRTENVAGEELVVENFFSLNSTDTIPEGTLYIFYANVFNDCGNHPDNIKAQITINGRTTEFESNGKFRDGNNVIVAAVIAEGNNKFKLITGNELLSDTKYEIKGAGMTTIKSLLPNYVKIAEVTKTTTPEDSRVVWGCPCGTFYPVEAAFKSPNHWQEPTVGDLSYFFAIQNMRCDQEIKSYTQDSLSKEFTLSLGKRVTQYLATLPSMVLKADPDQPQLAGLVYNTAASDVAVVKLGMPDGSDKVYRVTFGNV